MGGWYLEKDKLSFEESKRNGGGGVDRLGDLEVRGPDREWGSLERN